MNEKILFVGFEKAEIAKLARHLPPALLRQSFWFTGSQHIHVFAVLRETPADIPILIVLRKPEALNANAEALRFARSAKEGIPRVPPTQVYLYSDQAANPDGSSSENSVFDGMILGEEGWNDFVRKTFQVSTEPVPPNATPSRSAPRRCPSSIRGRPMK